MKDTEKKPKRLHSDIVRDSINTFGTNAIGSLLSIISAFFVLGVLDPDVKGQYNQVQLVGKWFVYTVWVQHQCRNDLLCLPL